MKTILLIRHAKSSWDDPGQPDFDRPLNARGQKDAAKMSARLRERVPVIDLFCASPANRAKTTAEIFAAAYKLQQDQLIFERGLYLAPANFFYPFIAAADNSATSMALFAHNPGITDFANLLSTSVNTDNIPTCGIFAVTAAVDSWTAFEKAPKELLLYDYPKLIG
ncbi:MAG TPA: histidine phosphatase family protein [Chitinophagaceae bacterium]|nr:histidine phosphatase family protein [Chitinophagaceae bacterium]